MTQAADTRRLDRPVDRATTTCSARRRRHHARRVRQLRLPVLPRRQRGDREAARPLRRRACATCSASGRSPAATSRAAPPTSRSRAPDEDGFWEAHVKLMTRSRDADRGRPRQRSPQELGVTGRDWRRPAGAGCARRRRHRERQGERRARDADVLHQRPPLRRAVGRSSLADAMLGSLGHRVQSAAFEFASWAPSSGVLLLLMSLLALALSNSPLGAGVRGVLGDAARHRLRRRAPSACRSRTGSTTALLTIFFLRRRARDQARVHRRPPGATRRSAALPIAAAIGGMAVPAVIYALVIPPGALAATAGACRSRPTRPSRSR